MKNSKKPSNSSSRPALTSGHAAAHCQVSTPTLKSWIREGQLHAFRTPGGHVRIAVEDFQRFLKKHRMPAYPRPAAPAGVLIVDDEPQMVDILVDFLTSHARGFKIETATDGYEALIKLGSLRPALVILDVIMPKLDGIEVCRHLKTNSETRAIKILGITGYPHMVPGLLVAGADACLAKPLALDSLDRELARLLAPSGGA
ncbi:MAG: hypothetical protein DMD94_02110 [Candidatus Rokuibacteriota bacterium]|nr:MAG: hypothetical protein DMD94_02110 [Candidatus Rokubacteria bacterium]